MDARRREQRDRLALRALPPARLGLLAILVVWPAAAQTPPAVAPCPREEGGLARYLLCVELQARRPVSTHAGYYAELEELEAAVLRQLDPQRSKKRRNILPELYHAAREDTVYLRRLTLVEALDGRRADPARRLAADCDLLSLINSGVSERYYGTAEHAARGVVLLRTRRDHVVTAFRRGTRIGGLLETETGQTYPDTPAVRATYERFDPMSEPEVVALYLAHVGLALVREARHGDALRFFDASLVHAPSEYVAHAGRALALLLGVAADAGPPSDVSRPWCAGEGGTEALQEAERSAEVAVRLEPGADSGHSLLGRILLHQCRPDRAREHLERAVRLRPDPVDLYYLGLILQGRGELDEAIRAIRRGHRLVRAAEDPRYRTLRLEIEFLLAGAFTRRAELEASRNDLRKALRLLDPLRRALPEDRDVAELGRAMHALDHRIGPVQRPFGIPQGLTRALYNASLEE